MEVERLLLPGVVAAARPVRQTAWWTRRRWRSIYRLRSKQRGLTPRSSRLDPRRKFRHELRTWHGGCRRFRDVFDRGRKR